MKTILSNLGVRAAITGQPEELEGDENIKEWAAMDEKALSTIQMCVSDSTLQEILTEITAAGAWNKLEETFMKKKVTNRLRLKQRFYSLRMAEGTTLKSHIS
jgi:gag-polypeptide of LTR copia-type